jgi:FKBP-type peptidyl-prolyl cis-trans isomerase FkpA
MNPERIQHQGAFVKKESFAVFLAAFAVACASAQDPKSTAPARSAEAATPACKPVPTELVVKDLKQGEGRPLIPRASVMVFYTGWLYDGCKADFKGAQFDSNRERPVPFGLMVGAGRVMKGWDEGLVGMKEKGGKRLLIIPPEKAYGDKAQGNIPANSALVFEVDTVGIGFYPETPAAK